VGKIEPEAPVPTVPPAATARATTDGGEGHGRLRLPPGVAAVCASAAVFLTAAGSAALLSWHTSAGAPNAGRPAVAAPTRPAPTRPAPTRPAAPAPRTSSKSKFDPSRFVPPPARADRDTLLHLRTWLRVRRLNDQDGLSNEHTEGALARMPELPYVRTHCRELFGVNDVTERTVERLQDWLCVTYGVTQQAASAMTLAEVAARLKFYVESAR
jgi:hypothetical protein